MVFTFGLSLGKGGQEAMAGNEYATIPVNQAQPLPAKEPLGDTNAWSAHFDIKLQWCFNTKNKFYKIYP